MTTVESYIKYKDISFINLKKKNIFAHKFL